MKKNLVFIVIIIILAVTNSLSAYNGYMVLNTGEKVEVTIKISDGLMAPGTTFYDLQWGIKYYDKEDKKQNIKLSLVKELYFKIDTNEYKMVCFKNTMKVKDKNYVAKDYVLLYLVQKRELSNYSNYYGTMNYKVVGPSMMNPGGNKLSLYSVPINADWIFLNVLQIEGKEPIKVTNRSFKKPLLEYLAACRDVTSKIENETFGEKDLIKIVEEYNNVCK
jgi:hypothetical protein